MKTGNSVSILLAAVALTALGVPDQAFAQMKHSMPMADHGARHGQMKEPGMMGEMMGMCIEHAEKLGLTDGQAMKMKSLHREMQKKQARFMADQKIAEIELAEIMEPKDFDLEKASAAAKKISAIKTDHHLGMLSAMKEMRSILTEQQYGEMMKMAAMMGEKEKKQPALRHQKKHK